MSTSIKLILTLVLCFSSSGCAIYYLDSQTGAEHIWGFGHLALKASAPADGKQAVIRQVTLTGLALGLEDNAVGVSAGYDQRERLIIYDANTRISIQRPENGNFFLFRLGSEPSTTISPSKQTNH